MMKNKYVTRILSCFLAVAMIVTLAACGRADTKDTQTEEKQENSPTVAEPTESSTNDESVENTDTASEGGDTAQGDSKGSDCLFYCRREQWRRCGFLGKSYTTIGGTAVGRLRAVADMIQENTDGDLFSIQTAVVYPADGGELIDYAAEEQDENARRN